MTHATIDETYSNGDSYSGDVVDGVKSGRGTYTFANGSKFDGEWADGKMSGWGTFLEASTGDNFEGEWERGMRRYGLYFYHSGDVYQGEFKNNMKNGRGVVWENRVMYEVMYDEDTLVHKVEFNTRAPTLTGAAPLRSVQKSPPRAAKVTPEVSVHDLMNELVDLRRHVAGLYSTQQRPSSAGPGRGRKTEEEHKRHVEAVTTRLYPYSKEKPKRKIVLSSGGGAQTKFEHLPEKGNAYPGPTPLGMWDMGQCDVTRCTGRRLSKRGLLRVLAIKQKFPGIVLSPTGTQLVSPEDREIVRVSGACVVDCSWNKLNEVPWRSMKMGHPRLLPYLVAANSCHYGQASELSCAEALAAALYIVGQKDEAKIILEPFRWGSAFFTINGEVMDLYAKCKNSAEVDACQKAWVVKIQEERNVKGSSEWALMEDENGDLLPPANPNRRGQPAWLPTPPGSSSGEED